MNREPLELVFRVRNDKNAALVYTNATLHLEEWVEN